VSTLSAPRHQGRATTKVPLQWLARRAVETQDSSRYLSNDAKNGETGKRRHDDS